MSFSDMESEELRDLVVDFKTELWNISYDWHNVAPLLRHKIVAAEEELTRRGR